MAEAELIEMLVARDPPFCEAALTPEFVAGMNGFACDLGLLTTDVAYEQVVAEGIRPW